MYKKIFHNLCRFLCILLFFILLTHSNLVLFYAKGGLHMWAVSVLPVLLPFIILSKFWIYYDVPEALFFAAKKALSGHSSAAISLTVLFLGLSSGFPVGAIFVTYFYQKHILTKKAAEELLPLCSFVSPMFLIGYVKPFIAYHGFTWILFILSLYLPILLLFLKGLFSGEIYVKNTTPSGGFSMPGQSSIQEIWASSLEIALTIGIYMMLFSILFGLAIHQPFLSNPVIEVLLSNLEVTTGICFLSQISALTGTAKGMVFAAVVAFGGLCTMAQVYTIISETDLSLKRYLFSKGAAAALSVFFFFLFKIFFTSCGFYTIA